MCSCDLNDVELLRKFYLKGAYSVPIVSELMLELEPYVENDYIKEALSGSFMQFDRDKAILLSAIVNEKLMDYQ